jgi:hypothetical protein
MLGSFCLVVITGSGLGIICNHDDNNDDTTPFLSMFMRYALLIQDHICLFGTWRTIQENSAPTVLYGSGLS